LCYLCEEQAPSIQFFPCNHVLCCFSCSKIPKKCPKCRMQIQEKDDSCLKMTHLLSDRDDVIKRKNSIRNNSKDSNCSGEASSTLIGRAATANQISNQIRSKNQDTALKSLQAKYDELRNRVICVICVDNIVNMVFLCGHGACQICGDKCSHCPICRKPIENKILLYCH
jgi:E3 ubiquitin-protein ligase mind-bomb